MTINVIEIIDEYTIIVNIGSDGGLQKGDKLRIIEQGEPIQDLDGIEIGTVDIIKAEVEATVIYPSFSICQKLRHTLVNILDPLADLKHQSTRAEKLSVNQADISHRKIPSAKPIAVGDIVIRL